MDKNTVIGLVLIGAILMGWGYFTKPSQEQIERAKHARDSIQLVQETQRIETQKLIDEQNRANAAITETGVTDTTKQGVFFAGTQGENEFYEIENEKLILKISKRGGRLYSVELKDYKTCDSLPQLLFNGDTTVFGLTFLAKNTKDPIRTNNLFWNKYEESKTDTTTVFKIRLTPEENKYIEYVYTIPHKGYMIDFDMNVVNMADIISSNYFTFDWSYMVPRSEKSYKWESQRTTIYYKYTGGDVDYLSETADDEEKLTEKIQWVGFKTHFFNTTLIAKDNLTDVILNTKTPATQNQVKELKMNSYIQYAGKSNEQHKFSLYFGPNDFYELDSHNLELEKMIPLGWGIFRWVNRGIIIPLFYFLSRFIGNYGIIILLLTIIIKLCLFPLTYKSYLSTAKMKLLKPEIDEINKKYPDSADAMKKQQATMALYKKAGANPMGGCLPMLLQMPFLIAMFSFFPASIELRQQSFLWAADLSSYDAIVNLPFNIPWYGSHVSLFCLLMAITNIIYVKVGDQASMNNGMPGMKVMLYAMPVMMLFWFNDYASGLSYYYFLSLLITIGQTLIFRKVVNEKKMMAKIQANKAKPVTKSNFQKRLEEAARKQKALQNQRKK